MSRPFGCKNKGKYHVSAAVLAQRRGACLTRRRCRLDKKTGLRKPIGDRGVLRCVSDFCGGDVELERVFKGAMVDVLRSPVASLAKSVGEVEARKFAWERSHPGEPLSPLLLKALELKVKAVKELVRAKVAFDVVRRGGGGRRVGYDRGVVFGDVVVDAEVFEEESGEKKEVGDGKVKEEKSGSIVVSKEEFEEIEKVLDEYPGEFGRVHDGTASSELKKDEVNDGGKEKEEGKGEGDSRGSDCSSG